MKSQKSIVRASARATQQLMLKVGGRKTPASGAWLEKADGRVPGVFRIETKCPPTGKYRLYRRDWDVLWKIAVQASEVAVFHIKLAPGVEIAIMRDSDYRAMGGEGRSVSVLDVTEKSWGIDVDAWILLSTNNTNHHYLPFKNLMLRVMPIHDFIRLARAQGK